MKKPGNKILVAIIISIIVFGGFLYSLEYFELFTPQSEIFIEEVSFSYHQKGCFISFDLVNSGNTTSFVDVDTSFGYLVNHNQYLLKANNINEKNMWIDEISEDKCNKQNGKIVISKIIKWNSYFQT